MGSRCRLVPFAELEEDGENGLWWDVHCHRKPEYFPIEVWNDCVCLWWVFQGWATANSTRPICICEQQKRHYSVYERRGTHKIQESCQRQCVRSGVTGECPKMFGRKCNTRGKYLRWGISDALTSKFHCLCCDVQKIQNKNHWSCFTTSKSHKRGLTANWGTVTVSYYWTFLYNCVRLL